MRTLSVALILSVACAATASAAGTMSVRSNVRTDVYLDGQLLGSTPLTINDIPRGDHDLELVETSSNKTKQLYFRIPAYMNISRDIAVDFHRNDPDHALLRADGSERNHAASPSRHYRDRRDSPPRRRDNSKVRIRNTALGVGAVGLLTGSGPLKALGFGGALVNELVNK